MSGATSHQGVASPFPAASTSTQPRHWYQLKHGGSLASNGAHHPRLSPQPDPADPLSALPLSPAACHPHRRFRWRASCLHPLELLRYQTWGALAVLIPAAAITSWSHWYMQKTPTIREALVYDASISYPMAAQDTVPNNLAVMGNWVAFVVAVLAVELGLLHHHHALTTSLASVVHWCWLCAVNFVVVVTITEVSKPYTGRLRPDFLRRCDPPLSQATTFQLFQATQCSNPDSDTVQDGRLSFPSGHASNSMSVAWFTALYLVWSLYLREGVPYPRHLFQATHFLSRLLMEVAYALLYCFLLFVLLLSWFIGLTRFWDNRHNVSDVLGGFLVAVLFTTPAFLAALGQYRMFAAIMDDRAIARRELRGQGGTTPHGATAGDPGVLPVTAPAAAASTGSPPVPGPSTVAAVWPAGAAAHPSPFATAAEQGQGAPHSVVHVRDDPPS